MKYDFGFLDESDLEVMQRACEQFPEDREFREAILDELRERNKTMSTAFETPQVNCIKTRN